MAAGECFHHPIHGSLRRELARAARSRGPGAHRRLLGGLVGFECECARRPAGLRTHAILAAASALLVGMATMLIDHFSGETAPAILRADPIRIAEALVAGVGFLGAGPIFRDGRNGSVEGFTTAASMLLVATIGVAVALGALVLAVTVTVLTLLLRSVTLVTNKISTEDPGR